MSKPVKKLQKKRNTVEIESETNLWQYTASNTPAQTTPAQTIPTVSNLIGFISSNEIDMTLASSNELSMAFIESNIEPSDQLQKSKGKRFPVYIENKNELFILSAKNLKKNKDQFLVLVDLQKRKSPESENNTFSDEDNNFSDSLIADDFNYTISIVNSKLNTLYKLCRFLGDQQQQVSKDL
ncbi:12680_t:CDS:2 [Gigaspora margarita]|uniref:12680_t:CDS:1 n=1 Tax=Gigaspora margarita TaxID=4874 RepID=A0ABM8W1W4_GIGMA|nr:12680_t:CDS:2 [Gigaspora margarita]